MTRSTWVSAVINEDRVAPGAGFPTHSHRDMEIITYVLEGALAHKDSTGTSSVIRVGEVQRMSAGTGISHSEYNASPTEAVHFLQIWIMPNKTRLAPAYEQRALPLDEHRDKWTLIGSEAGRDGSVTVHQNIDIWAARFAAGAQVSFRLKSGRHGFAHLARGAITFNGTTLNPAMARPSAKKRFSWKSASAVEAAELLLFPSRLNWISMFSCSETEH